MGDISFLICCRFGVGTRFSVGAISHEGRIYSVEGFANGQVNRPAIRVIHTGARCDEIYVDLVEWGYGEEPEMIDFYVGGVLLQ